MVDILDVGEFSTRVGAVRFSHVAVREFYFDQHYEREELKRAIDRMHFTGSTTNTSGALRLASLIKHCFLFSWDGTHIWGQTIGERKALWRRILLQIYANLMNVSGLGKEVIFWIYLCAEPSI